MASQLEQQLFEELLAKYKAKDRNVQSILRNSLFQQLPLEAKINILENNLEHFEDAPSFKKSLKNSPAALLGVLGGASAAFGTAATRGFKPGLGVLLATTAVGGLAGAIPGALGAYKNYKDDVSTSKSLQDNRYLQALVGRSSQGVAGPIPARVIDQVANEFNSRLLTIDSI